ncbi:hypothetical protein [Butyrivibrio fibrisolvens]|uniref:hypothetical protein n=1 Tax=Butyrivibrio fibrisolvens TaxID=831 RepID=UPI00040383CB|nr:hypothetical protein [Butyrivibrio fibrisolvens]
MKISHRSVLATGIAVALVSQAPIVALADSPITEPVVVTASDKEAGEPSSPTQVTITVDGKASENNDFTASINTNGNSSTNNNYDDATVRVNDNIVVQNETNPALTVSSTATTTVTVGDEDRNKTNALIVVIDNKTVSSGDSNGYGEAISTSGNGCVEGLGTTVNGSITNSGQGDVAISERRTSSGNDAGHITDVNVTGTGDVGIVGDVYGTVTNNDDRGSIYINGNVEGNIVSSGTIVSSNSNDVTVAYGNVTVINDTISEDQIQGSPSNLFVYQVVDGSDSNPSVDKNPHYIIKISGVSNASIVTANTTDGVTTYITEQQGLNVVQNTASTSMMPASWNYADAGQTITFYVPDGYDHYFSVKAEHIGGGQYVLTVPAGGGVTIQAWMKQVIEDTISSETGTPATIVDEDPSAGGTPATIVDEDPSAGGTPTYTGDIGSVDGIDFISTDAGLALPTTELGDAVVATLSVSLDMSKITPVQFRDAVTTTIGRAPVGGVAVIETSEVATLDSNMIAAMQTRPDVEYVIVFNHDGFKKKVVIPAGYDYSLLLDEYGYCGFLRLAALLGFTYLD